MGGRRRRQQLPTGPLLRQDSALYGPQDVLTDNIGGLVQILEGQRDVDVSARTIRSTRLQQFNTGW